jgi:cobalt/nickel transport system permease protein
MQSIEGTLLDFRRIDQLASGNSFIHRIDARAKIFTTLFFIFSVISFKNHEISSLLPFFIFPVVISAQGNIPFSFILKKLVMILPFAIMIGIFNPLFDRNVLVSLGFLEITGGWISFLSIIIRTMLTVSVGIILIGVTGFNVICQALNQMGIPQPFTNQLLFLYRYIFVLAEEVSSISSAYKSRSLTGNKVGIRTFTPLLGNLLLRTWERAERIHLAMLARGYNGVFYKSKVKSLNRTDLLFLFGWTSIFIALRFNNLSVFIGRLITGIAE